MTTMAIDSDGALLTAIAQGERDALAMLYDRYAGLMLGLAQRILGNRRDAEDLIHDVFLEIWRKAGHYDPARGTVRTWILVRLRSRALDRCKSAGRVRSVALEDAQVPEKSTAHEEASSLDRKRVRVAVEALPEKQRAVLRLAYFKGLSASEIARELDIPVGTAKSRAAAGLRGLRRGLQEGVGGEA